MKALLQTRPVTPETWKDFETLFSTKGSPHYCWCTPYRFRDAANLTSDEKRAAMEASVDSATPIGVLAYDAGNAVGWCSVAPRQTYAKLERSRTMPRVSKEETWTILCFFVPRPMRGHGILHALLAGAVEYARDAGAAVVEGYPFDTANISSTHRGHSSVFKQGGFVQEGTRWFRTL